MGSILFIVIAINVVLFAGLGIWAWRQWQAEESPRIRVLTGALVVGSAGSSSGRSAH